MGNELALDVNVLWLLILSLFFVSIVTATAWRVIAVIAYQDADQNAVRVPFLTR